MWYIYNDTFKYIQMYILQGPVSIRFTEVPVLPKPRYLHTKILQKNIAESYVNRQQKSHVRHMNIVTY